MQTQIRQSATRRRIFSLAIAPLLIAAPLLAVNLPNSFSKTTYLGYNPADYKNDLIQNITYQVPDASVFGPGPYPVFMWIPGTYENYQDPLSMKFVTEMARRGFLAATVQYANTNTVQVCSSYTDRTAAIFDNNTGTSAARVLCGLSSANCNQGVVVSGASQGAAIAILARNYSPQIQAVYVMGISDQGYGRVPLPCLDKGNTLIPADRLFIANGQSDQFFAGQDPLQNVSGYGCPSGSTQCWSPNGSGAGWYIVQNTQVVDGTADHCYQLVGGCGAAAGFDSGWYTPSKNNWSLAPNLDWLASFGTRRVYSASGL